MSLIGWWPLDGHSNDYSFNKLDLTGSATWNTSGKIGKCLDCNPSALEVPSAKIAPLRVTQGSDNYSLCVWWKQTGTPTVWHDIIHYRGKGGEHNRLEVGNSATEPGKHSLWCNIGRTSTSYHNPNIGPIGKWYHIAVVREFPKWRLYVNGNLLVEETISSSTDTGIDSYFNIAKEGPTSNSYVNDVRLYSHSLSVKEIKEIYKTKILHYKFNNEYEEPTTNKYANRPTPTGIGNSENSDSKMIFTKISDGYVRVRIEKKTDGNYWPNLQFPAYTFTAGKSYSINLDVRILNKAGSASIEIRNSAYSNDYNSPGRQAKSYSSKCGWDRCKLTRVINATYPSGDTTKNASPRLEIYTNMHKAGDIIEFEIKNWQVEEKDHSTPFVNDSRNLKVGDCSGYRNRGTIDPLKSPDWFQNGILGKGSFKFGSNKYIMIGNTCKVTEEITISAWVNHADWQTASSERIISCTEGGGWQLSLNDVSGKIGFTINLDGTYYHSVLDKTQFSTGWHLITGVYDGRYAKLYVDGILKVNTDSGASKLIKYHSTNGVFVGAEAGPDTTTPAGGYINAHISDIRIYATALSDSDVLELYNTKGSVSKNGRLFINEITERESMIRIQDITVSNLTTTGIAITPMSANGSRIISCTEGGSFRIYLPDNILTPGGEYTFSMDYRYVVGTKGFNISDFSDVAGTKSSSNDRLKITATRSSYDSTYRFVDCNIETGNQVEISNVSLFKGSNINSSVNKKGQLICQDISEIDLSSCKVKTENNANWVRIFYHNNRAGTVLFSSNKSEFLRCNTGDKISHLWALELFRGLDGKFEFLLNYQSGGTSYNRWKQSSNFTREPIRGYEAVQCSWTSNDWGGLAPSSTTTSTHVDGSPNTGTWYYAIGSIAAFTGGIPSWSGAETGWVELWVRCDNPNMFKIFKNGKVQSSEFMEV